MKTAQDIEKVTQFETPEESPGFMLWHVSVAWRSLIEETLKPLNLTHPQFVVLATTAWLTRKGAVISQIEVSKAAGLDPNTTSQILRGLEKKKFIIRAQSVNEKNKNPSLTDQGFTVLQKAMPAVEKADASFFTLLSPDELQALLNTLGRLKPELP